MVRSSGVLVLLLVVAIVGSWEARLGGAKPSAAQCNEEKRVGVKACMPVLYGKLPSPECCRLIRVTHIECVCPVITPKMAALVDVNKAIRVVEGCGRRVPRHFKCGSITTP